MDNGNAKTDSESTTTWSWLASAFACILTVLMLTHFAVTMPFAGIDGSWAYAMNVATAQHLRFGSDIVFTFGPLASIYTGIYHPATDSLMLGGSLLIAIALFAGLFAVVPPQRRTLLLLLPVIISLGWGRDAALLFLPLLLPYVVMRGVERGKPFTATLCIVAAAMAILPLVKGNFGLIVALTTAIALILCWRSSRKTALIILAVQFVVMVGAWLISGQALIDLPSYFLAQGPTLSGYTDGMSVEGRTLDIAIFMVAGAFLLAISTLGGLRRHWYAPILVTAYLFITFKSGFVRHDEHALVSAVALAFVGLLLCLAQGGRAGALAVFAGLLGWGLIANAYMPVTWDTSTARFSLMVRHHAHGVWLRMTQPDLLSGQFKKQVAYMGTRPPFAGYMGTADVYPSELSPMLAAGGVWKPRPMLQSYAAYSPRLLKANAAHLANNPPSRVYFKVAPIDHRYPSLEDGASWLALLGSFTPKALDGGYAVLERADPGRPALVPQTPVQVSAVLGEEVTVVGSDQPVWVTMDIRPTLVGRLFSIFYKAPKLSLKVRYENGDTADFRLVAGMTQTGFLLSPTVADARDFVAIGSLYRPELLGKRKVVAFNVIGDSGTRFLWALDYRVSFARLDIPLSVEADTVLAGSSTPSPPPSSYATGGDCNIDDVDRRKVTASAMDLSGSIVVIRGWAALDSAKGRPNKGVALLVTGRDLVTHVVPASHVSRPDVADYFKQPVLEYAGYEAYVDVRQLPADAQIRVVQDNGSRQLLCSPAMLTIHRTDDVPAPSR